MIRNSLIASIILLAMSVTLKGQELCDVSIVRTGIPSQMVKHKNYSTSYNGVTKQPNWVSWCIDKDELQPNVSRNGVQFQPDPAIHSNAVTSMDYSRSGWDRGHMCPAADNKYDYDAMEESFYMTNICPQNHTLNEKSWNYLEAACRQWAQSGPLYIICGPYFKGKPKSHIGNARVGIPDGFWKVVLRFYKGSWRAIGFYMPNSEEDSDIGNYACAVNQIEELTGFDFYSALDDSYEETVEGSFDLQYWPHTRH